MAELELPFKEKHTEAERAAMFKRAIEKDQDRIPIILEKHSRSSVQKLQNSKYLANADLHLSEFQANIRKKLQLKPTEGLFFFLGGKDLSDQNATIGDVYEKYKDSDGFLYIVYSNQEKFGCNF